MLAQTMFHLPVPAVELIRLGMAVYTFGGSQLQFAAAASPPGAAGKLIEDWLAMTVEQRIRALTDGPARLQDLGDPSIRRE